MTEPPGNYVTVDNQSSGDVTWVGDGKDADVLGEFYTLLGPERCAALTAVSMDMGRAYASATRAHTAATICWDPLHVVKLLNKGDPRHHPTVRRSRRPAMPLRPRHAYAAGIQRDSGAATCIRPKSSPPNRSGCASRPSPHPPGSSWRES